MLSILFLLTLPFYIHGLVQESVLPSMDSIYKEKFKHQLSQEQQIMMEQALARRDEQLRVISYCLLHNLSESENKLPLWHRWENRRWRFLEYFFFANPDIFGFQGLEKEQLQEIMLSLGSTYDYCENGVIYNKERLDLLDFNIGIHFQDKITKKTFFVLNAQLSSNSPDERLAEALQLRELASKYDEEPLILLANLGSNPLMQQNRTVFFDTPYLEYILTSKNLENGKRRSIFGHFGSEGTVTHSKENFTPFSGPEYCSFVLDHILVNSKISVVVHGIDPAKVNGEFPSDHFPVIVDLYLK